MEEIAELGYFMVTYIEGLRLNTSVGVSEHDPQIWYIPDTGEIHELSDKFILNRFKISSQNRVDRYKNYVVEAYESGPVRHSLEKFLQDVRPFDVQVLAEIYSWQWQMPLITFTECYTEFDFVDIKAWENIREKWKDNMEVFDIAVDNLSRLGLLRLVSKSNPEYKVDHYIITPLAVRFMEFNDVVTKERSKINKKSRDQARKYIEQDELEE